MILGSNNGGFYRLKHDRLSDKVIGEIIKIGVNAIEFTLVDMEMLDNLLSYELPNNKFEFISVHAPMLKYKDDFATKDVLNKISQIHKRLNLENIVIHASHIADLDVFKSFNHLPLSVENMDNEQSFGRTVKDIKSITDSSDFNVTLDLQHCYVNDPTMKLADDFYKEFGDKIIEVHLSGYDKKFNHYTLHKTKQEIIIRFLKGKNIPIILESTYDSIEEAQQEINYVKERL